MPTTGEVTDLRIDARHARVFADTGATPASLARDVFDRTVADRSPLGHE